MMLRALRGGPKLLNGHQRAIQVGNRRHVVRAATAEPPVEEFTMSAAEIKAALIDSFWGTERGLTATSETRAEINELITQLEAKNPTASPTESLKLEGTWKLIYTSNSELVALLALARLPLVTVGDITQSINVAEGSAVNTLQLAGPGSRFKVAATAAITVQSPKRISLTFEKGTLSAPELDTDVDIPSSTTIMGQSIDLTSLKSALDPLQSAGRDALLQVANLLRQQPNLNIPIRTNNAKTWLLTTYVDDDLRISRGDAGSVFVLTKETPVPVQEATPAIEKVDTEDVTAIAEEAMAVEATTEADERVVPVAGASGGKPSAPDSGARDVAEADDSSTVEDESESKASKGKGSKKQGRKS